jgi:CBS domain-containing protein
MSHDPVRVTADALLSDVARHMTRRQIRHVPVVADGAPIGMVTDDQVARAGSLVGSPPGLWLASAGAPTTARETMEACAAVSADTPMDDALRLMRAGHDALVVVDDERRLVGVVTEHDAVRYAHTVVPAGQRLASLRPVGVLSVTPDTSVAAALLRMTEHGVRHLCLVGDSGLCGVVSLTLLRGIEPSRSHLTVDEARVAGPVWSLPSDATLDDAVSLMVTHHVGAVPLIDAGRRPVRMVTRSDVIESVIASLEEEGLFQAVKPSGSWG